MIGDILTRIIIYYATYAVGFILMLLLSLLRCPVYGSSRARAAAYSVITFLSGFAGALIIGVVYNFLFSLKGVETAIRVDMLGAVIFTSLFLLAAVYIEKYYWKRQAQKAAQDGAKAAPARTVSFRDTMDMMIPGSFLVFTCIKLGCHVRGCCAGVECGWGIYFPNRDITLFPVQLCEFASLCLILIGCYFIKQTRFFRRGMAGPLTACLYGFARFGWEFLRWYTPETRYFLFGLTLWQLFCLLVIAVSAVWLLILYKTQPGEPLPKGWLPQQGKKQPGNKKKNAPAKKRVKS